MDEREEAQGIGIFGVKRVGFVAALLTGDVSEFVADIPGSM
jgi:hypothetical protein